MRYMLVELYTIQFSLFLHLIQISDIKYIIWKIDIVKIGMYLFISVHFKKVR